MNVALIVLTELVTTKRSTKQILSCIVIFCELRWYSSLRIAFGS